MVRPTEWKVSQSGAALLVFMLVSFLIGMGWILSQATAEYARVHLGDVTASAMAEAKAALLGRAAQDDNRPGSLTCPDTDNDGVANQVGGNCTAYIGRLPWKTLDLHDLRDGNGERLWYALTPELRDNPSAQPINPLQAWTLRLNGADNFAALLFSAGPPLSTQNGRPSNDVSDYLDETNKDGGPNYVSKPVAASFNDVVLAITRNDLFRTVNMRVLGEVRGPDNNAPGPPTLGLRGYYADNSSFPWADNDNDGNANPGATLGGPPYNDLNLSASTFSWLNANAWLPLIKYQRVNSDSAIIAIDNVKMNVMPCPGSPCQ